VKIPQSFWQALQSVTTEKQMQNIDKLFTTTTGGKINVI
jgi:hypothetical protein